MSPSLADYLAILDGFVVHMSSLLAVRGMQEITRIVARFADGRSYLPAHDAS